MILAFPCPIFYGKVKFGPLDFWMGNTEQVYF